MSFLEDWLLKTLQIHYTTKRMLEYYQNNGEPIPAELDEEIKSSDRFVLLAGMLAKSQVIRVSAEQMKVFLEMPLVANQDGRWMHLPFEHIYLQLDAPIPWHNYKSEHVDAEPDQIIKGIYLGERDVRGIKVEIVDNPNERYPNAERILEAHFMMPENSENMLNMHCSSLIINSNGSIDHSNYEIAETQQVVLRFLVHMVNFLSSPSVKLVRCEPDVALQKARQKRGKEPLPGWYEITYRKVCGDYTKGTVSQKLWEHSFRYDVRGHFKRFDKGRMAGRVLWCPPHQRGLKHDLYKPKVYRAG